MRKSQPAHGHPVPNPAMLTISWTVCVEHKCLKGHKVGSIGLSVSRHRLNLLLTCFSKVLLHMPNLGLLMCFKLGMSLPCRI